MNASTTTVLLTHPNDLNYLEQGWALAQSQPNKRFTKQQIEFLVEKYEEGQRSGHKWNPAAVAMANIFVGIKKSEFASLDNEKREDKWSTSIFARRSFNNSTSKKLLFQIDIHPPSAKPIQYEYDT